MRKRFAKRWATEYALCGDKNVEQQGLLGLHRARQGFVVARTGQANQIRGLLASLGFVFPRGSYPRAAPAWILRMPTMDFTRRVAICLTGCSVTFESLTARSGVGAADQSMAPAKHGKPTSRGDSGIGPLTASALVASMRDAKAFKNGRQFAAWLGLVPRQDSSGGKERLLGSASAVTRTYARYSSTAHAQCCCIPNAVQIKRTGWLADLAARRNPNIAAVALANKNARIVWACSPMIDDTNTSTCRREAV